MKRHINLQFTKNIFTGTGSYWSLGRRLGAELFSVEDNETALRSITLDSEDAPAWAYDVLDTLLADVPMSDSHSAWQGEQDAAKTLENVLGVWHANKTFPAKFASTDLLGNQVNTGDNIYYATKCGAILASAAPWL